MVEAAFLTAQQMAQDLVRRKAELTDIAALLTHLLKHKEVSGEALSAYLQSQEGEQAKEGEETISPIREAYETYLRPIQDDPQKVLDVLGWSVDFMRYYRGEGNRPHPDRRTWQPETPRPRHQGKEEREVKVQLEALQPGQLLQGTIRRVMPYGVFVDVGAGRDGLVHVSEMEAGYTADPAAVVNVGETVGVWVKGVDTEKKRISLTMRDPAAMSATPPRPQAERPPAEPRSSTDARRKRGPRRRERERSAEGKALFEDEVPKEMTALGEALRTALTSHGETPAEGKSRRKKKQSHTSEELAEAFRRTLLG